MIIWGTRTMEKVFGQLGVVWQCDHCGGNYNYKVIRRMTWFTLFFIPIFPFHIQYLVICPNCSYGKKVPKKEALEILERYGRLELG